MLDAAKTASQGAIYLIAFAIAIIFLALFVSAFAQSLRNLARSVTGGLARVWAKTTAVVARMSTPAFDLLLIRPPMWANG